MEQKNRNLQNRNLRRLDAALTALIVLSGLTLGACGGGQSQSRKHIEPIYDQQTGRLKQLNYDSKNNGKFDTVSYMDGARVLRIEIDTDGDGKVDRWEYYGADQKLAKVGFSRAKDGKEDAWSYAGPDGTIERIEISTRRDGKIGRTEHYVKDLPVRAEEDTDGDGVVDKWETFQSGRLTSVAFDTTHRGSPERRLNYAADGTVRVEVDPQGNGQWTAHKP
jgi:hypothetical protein